MPAVFRRARIDGLSTELRAVLAARRPGQSMLLWGSAGVGKSWATAALVRSIIVRHRSEIDVRRASYDTLLLEIRECFRPVATKSELDVIGPYLKCDLLWLDDLGATESLGGAASDFAARVVFTLLNERIERERVTFVTSNLSPENLHRAFGDRIGSRLREFKAVRLVGKDQRGNR